MKLTKRDKKTRLPIHEHKPVVLDEPKQEAPVSKEPKLVSGNFVAPSKPDFSKPDPKPDLASFVVTIGKDRVVTAVEAITDMILGQVHFMKDGSRKVHVQALTQNEAIAAAVKIFGKKK